MIRINTVPKKPIAVFDIDGTIFRSSLLIEVTNALIQLGAFPVEISKSYEPEYLNWLNRTGTYEDYLDKLVTAFTSHIPDVHRDQLKAASEKVISNMGRRTYRYTRDLIKSLQPTHFLVAISGSPIELVSRFTQSYGFNDYHAAILDRQNNYYTGKIRRGDTHKDKTVDQMISKHNLTLKGSIGVGDSDSDVAFLNLVERPIAFNPNSVLFQTAVKNNWQVVAERKDVIYYYNQTN